MGFVQAARDSLTDQQKAELEKVRAALLPQGLPSTDNPPDTSLLPEVYTDECPADSGR